MNEHLAANLIVPAESVRMTAKLLRSMRGAEAGCFWLGRRDKSDVGVVEGVIIPRQQNNRGQYHVTADAMVQVANVARERAWRHLAQVHSHPGSIVNHSAYDDHMANSRRALSLVYPYYGAARGMWRFRGWLWALWPRPFPADIGVHAFRNDRWTFLGPAEIQAAITIVAGPAPALIDLRS